MVKEQVATIRAKLNGSAKKIGEAIVAFAVLAFTAGVLWSTLNSAISANSACAASNKAEIKEVKVDVEENRTFIIEQRVHNKHMVEETEELKDMLRRIDDKLDR